MTNCHATSACRLMLVLMRYRRIHADVIVYIFAHLHTALRIEENTLDMN